MILYIIIGILIFLILSEKKEENFTSVSNCEEQISILNLVSSKGDFNLLIKDNELFNDDEKYFLEEKINNEEKLPETGLIDIFKKKYNC
jgi:hypothetical protein